MSAYIPPRQYSKADIEEREALAGIAKCETEIKALEKKILHRSTLRNLGFFEMKNMKKEHADLTKKLNAWKKKLDKIGGLGK